jgi:hypothetical protein
MSRSLVFEKFAYFLGGKLYSAPHKNINNFIFVCVDSFGEQVKNRRCSGIGTNRKLKQKRRTNRLSQKPLSIHLRAGSGRAGTRKRGTGSKQAYAQKKSYGHQWSGWHGGSWRGNSWRGGGWWNAGNKSWKWDDDSSRSKRVKWEQDDNGEAASSSSSSAPSDLKQQAMNALWQFYTYS